MQSPIAALLAASPAAPSEAPAAAVASASASGLQSGAGGSSQARAPGRDAPAGGALEATPPSSPSSASSHPSAELSMGFLDGEAGSLCGDAAAGGCVFLRRVRSLPAVQALLGAYAGAKAYPGVGWALSVGEKSALLGAAVCRPVAFVCGVPQSCADWSVQGPGRGGDSRSLRFVASKQGQLDKMRIQNCLNLFTHL
ncbi:hypothetical protein R5R35_013123 [Gryllus longicercus]|uniref:Uncharacterized protein n=1 Tax=Gryllus longicercus TaxID=2509291 RepID=A0AAN9W8D5_9ORTH